MRFYKDTLKDSGSLVEDGIIILYTWALSISYETTRVAP